MRLSLSRWTGGDAGPKTRSAALMIFVPAGVPVWLASGANDMRCGTNSLALQVQQVLERDLHGSNVFVLWDKRGDLLKECGQTVPACRCM